MNFVDTNYFLRFLLEDQESQHKTVKNLFLQAVNGKTKLFTSAVVIFEVHWVLESFYQKEKQEIIRILTYILSFEFIKIQNRKLFLQAIEVYKDTSLSIEDSFNLVYAKSKKATDFKTFDKKLQKEFRQSQKNGTYD